MSAVAASTPEIGGENNLTASYAALHTERDMNTTTEQMTRATTATHCHCGAAFEGSDHCPECYCEQYEATCDHVYVPDASQNGE